MTVYLCITVILVSIQVTVFMWNIISWTHVCSGFCFTSKTWIKVFTTNSVLVSCSSTVTNSKMRSLLGL